MLKYRLTKKMSGLVSVALYIFHLLSIPTYFKVTLQYRKLVCECTSRFIIRSSVIGNIKLSQVPSVDECGEKWVAKTFLFCAVVSAVLMVDI